MEISDVERIKILKEVNTQLIPSRFGFLNVHNGLRPSKVHVLLSYTGAGKTTILKAILEDTACAGRIGIYLSEETERDFKYQAIISGFRETTLKNLSVFSEPDFSDEDLTVAATINKIKEFIKKVNPVALFLDNVTTLSCYEGSDNQVKFAAGIKRVAEEFKIPIFCIAHTATGISSQSPKLIAPDDLKGNRKLAMIAPYFYCFQMFETEDGEKFPFINVQKCRAPNIKDTIYALEYNPKHNIHTGDKIAPFHRLKEIYKARATL